MAMGNCGFVADTSATTYDIGTAIDFCINGKAYTKATVSNGASPTTDGTTGAAFNAILPDKACVVVVALNSSGTVSFHQGPIVDVDGTADTLKHAAQLPLVDTNTYCPIAYLKLQTDGTSSAAGLLPGTANWDATGLTTTVVNLITLPARPVA